MNEEKPTDAGVGRGWKAVLESVSPLSKLVVTEEELRRRRASRPLRMCLGTGEERVVVYLSPRKGLLRLNGSDE